MKELSSVFKERLKDIQANLEDGNYAVCYRIAHDLVNLSWNLELKDEVFISEVLESVYSNLSNTIENYSVPKDVSDKLKNEMSEAAKPLPDAYDSGDSSKLYEVLKAVRYTATLYQLTAWQRYDKPKRTMRTYYD